jgi:hypothetical protein
MSQPAVAQTPGGERAHYHRRPRPRAGLVAARRARRLDAAPRAALGAHRADPAARDTIWRLATGAISGTAAAPTAHLEGPRDWRNRCSTSCPLCAEDWLESDAARARPSERSSFEAAGASLGPKPSIYYSSAGVAKRDPLGLLASSDNEEVL